MVIFEPTAQRLYSRPTYINKYKLSKNIKIIQKIINFELI